MRGTGGGPEKTILLGAERADRARVSVTVCYIRDARDAQFGIGARARQAGVDYVELIERGSFDRRRLAAARCASSATAASTSSTRTTTRPISWRCCSARSHGTIPLSTAHGWTGHSPRERWLYYPLDKQMLRAFPLTIAVSSQIKSELVRHHVRGRSCARRAQRHRPSGVPPRSTARGGRPRLARHRARRASSSARSAGWSRRSASTC